MKNEKRKMGEQMNKEQRTKSNEKSEVASKIARLSFFIFLFSFLLSSCTNPFMERLFSSGDKIIIQDIPVTVSYTVSFDSKGGSPVDSQQVTEGEKATRPNNPTKSGFGFVNWYDNAEYIEPHYNFNTPVTADITLYAKWSDTFYTVTFNSNGGIPAPEPQDVGEGGTASKPIPEPGREGFEFIGWYSDPDLTIEYDFENTPVTADITLYAKWIAINTVTFNANGDGVNGLPAPLTAVRDGATISKPSPDPSRIGYSFAGWYKEAEGINAWDFDNDTVTEDITLYAKWTENTAIIEITVEQITDLSFDDIDGGIIYRNANPSSISFEYIDTDTDSTCKWTIDGVGAYAGLIPLSDTASCTVDATNPKYNSLGRHAIYLDVVKNDVPYKKTIWVTIMGGDIYTVSFDTNGGSTVASQQIVEGTRATRPDNPTMSGYGFVDWYDNADLTGSHYDFNTPVTGNIILYAKWSNNFYTVSFNSNGGSAVPSQLVVEGGTASRPMSNPTKEDFAFGGWYGDSALTALYDFNTPVAGTITLYARWLAFFTVSFDTDGGSAVASKQVLEGGKASRPQNPTKANLSFENWYSNSALTALYNFNSPVTGNITLYAKWVTYNEADFGAGATITTINGVSNTTQWDNAVSTIKGGGNNKNYIINVIGNFNVAGSTNSTFGSVTGIKVSLRGVGRTVGLSSNGALIRPNTNQTVILRDLTLQGRSSNNRQLVWVANGAFVMHSGKITGNTGGRAVTVGSGSSFTMHGGEISGNTGAGGVDMSGDNATFTMHGGVISGNKTSGGSGGGSGGGVYMTSACTFTMYGGIISGNSGGDGGGVCVNTDATFTMHGGEISGNTATNGGGVYAYRTSGTAGTFTMNGGIVSGNNAVDGGGVWVSRSVVTMHGGEISGNTATNDGGGVCVVTYGTFTMHDGKISGNAATGNGGGVSASSSLTDITMNGGEISGNTATGNGGGVYMTSRTFTMHGGEISGNTAKTSGGGMYVNSGTFRLVTGTIYGSNEVDTSLKNTATTSGAALFKIANRTAQRGTFSGDTWVSSGDLVTTEDTVRVQNGEMQ